MFVVDGALSSIVVAAIHIVYFVAAANAVVAAKLAKFAAASAVPPHSFQSCPFFLLLFCLLLLDF